jgi:hypothetical protein
MSDMSDYKKAIGDPVGLAELTVFYCERAEVLSEEWAGSPA